MLVFILFVAEFVAFMFVLSLVIERKIDQIRKASGYGIFDPSPKPLYDNSDIVSRINKGYALRSDIIFIAESHQFDKILGELYYLAPKVHKKLVWQLVRNGREDRLNAIAMHSGYDRVATLIDSWVNGPKKKLREMMTEKGCFMGPNPASKKNRIRLMMKYCASKESFRKDSKRTAKIFRSVVREMMKKEIDVLREVDNLLSQNNQAETLTYVPGIARNIILEHALLTARLL
jgi:hypothetical protein